MTHRCNMIGLRPRLRRVLDLAPPREKEKQKQKKKTMMTKREPKQKQNQERRARSRRKQQEQAEAEATRARRGKLSQKALPGTPIASKRWPTAPKVALNPTKITTFSDFEGYLDHFGRQAPKRLHFRCNFFANGLQNDTQNR